MRLLKDRVLVLPIKDEDKTKSGIILPKGQQKNNLGEVIIVSEKAQFLKVGDKVKYYEHTGTPIDYLGKTHLILSEGVDIISVL